MVAAVLCELRAFANSVLVPDLRRSRGIGSCDPSDPMQTGDMWMRRLGTILLLGASTAMYPAEDYARPSCSEQNAGAMWPEAANHDPKALLRLARCGRVRMCVQHRKKYCWESLTVRIDQLRAPAARDQADGCEVPPPAGSCDGPSASTSKRSTKLAPRAGAARNAPADSPKCW